MRSDNPAFGVVSPGFPQSISPEGTLSATVRFSPTAASSYAGTLTISSDDPYEPSLSVSLTRQGKVPRPDLRIHLISFPQTTTAMEQATVELKIINDGDARSPSGDLEVGLCVLMENLQPFQGDVIDLGRIEAIEPGCA
ncbi:MAG: hypothetical protein J7J76_02930 [Candidatus Latescibacteria bacterium]|nr:hypothetical protein [Candidatus Latescibacterota bacterium]